MTTQQLNEINYRIIGAAIEVHKELGPGLEESIYELCLMEELKMQDLKVQRQVKVPVLYKGIRIDKDYFIDILVEDEIILELKCTEKIHSIHEVQLVTYLKLTNKRLGLLLNFNVPQMTKGIVRKVNNF